MCTFRPNLEKKAIKNFTFLSSFLGGKSMSEVVRPVEGREDQIAAHNISKSKACLFASSALSTFMSQGEECSDHVKYH